MLRAIGVGAAGTLVSTAARGADDSAKTHKTEVVIVGAGFAGLTAARELVRKGRNVTVWKRVIALGVESKEDNLLVELWMWAGCGSARPRQESSK